MHRRPVAWLAALMVAFLVLAPGTASADETPAPVDPTATPTATEIVGQEPPPVAVAEPPDSQYYIAVRLVDSTSTDPIVGVSVTVQDPNGNEVGSMATDTEGKAYIPIEGGGEYTVALDTDSLPEGIGLSEDTPTELTKQVFLEGATFVDFPIGLTQVEAVGFLETFSQSLVKGLKLGLILALAGLGLSLIFGTTGLTNFAHGELMTFGAIAAFVFNRGVGLPVIPAAILATVVAGLFGWVQEKGLWGPLRRRGTGLIAMMIVSIGMAILLRYLFQYGFGGSRRSYTQYRDQGPNEWGPIKIADKEIAIIVVSILVLTVVCIAMMTTRWGKAMRAVADNPALAASSGLNVDGVITSVWVLGTALTGLGGIFYGIDQQVQFVMGFNLLLLVFAAITLGGLGTIWGAILGSIIIGVFVEAAPTISIFGVQPIPDSIKNVGALGILIVILLVRPQGLLGKAQRVG